MNNFINGLMKENLKFYESKWDKTYKEIVEQIVKQVAEATANEILKGYWEDTVIDTASNMKNICNEITSQCKGDSHVK